MSIPTFEARLDDILGVLDTEEIERAAFLGYGDGASLAAAFAATHPTRCQALVVLGDTILKTRWDEDNPGGITPEEFAETSRLQMDAWGDPSRGADFARLAEGEGSHLAEDPEFGPWFAKIMRYSSSPGDVAVIDRIWYETDATSIVDLIQVPTALLYRRGWPPAEIEACRRLADRIPGARTIELPGEGYLGWSGDSLATARAITEFVSGLANDEARFDRVLATVLFTDLVGSTEHLARVGDRAWSQTASEHLRRTRHLLARYRGREIDTAGDGFFAAFDGPGRAVKAGLEIVEAMRPIGLDVRVGVHTGELIEIDAKVSGIAVNAGARVAATAEAGEVRVTSTVKDLVAGAGFSFTDLGEHELKGIEGLWRLYRAAEGAMRA